MDFFDFFINVPQNIVIVSPEYKILAATNAYLKVTMETRENIVGKHFLKEIFVDPAYSYEENPVIKSLDRAKETKEVDYLDVIRYDLPTPDGRIEVRYWEASHTPVLDEKGNVKYLIQNTMDVTEREKAKQSAAETEHKFQFMAEVIPQLIITTNPQGEANYFNGRWSKYTGVPKEEITQQNVHKFIHPNDLEKVRATWQKALQEKEAFAMELRIRDKEGNYRWFLNRTLPMCDQAGNILMWVGSSTDIDETRKLVQELVSTNEQMAELADQVQQAYQKAESERKTLERLIMDAPAIFCTLKGPGHKFDLVNQHYQALFPGRELVGKSVAEALPEVIEQGFIGILDNVYRKGEKFVAEETPIMLDKYDSGKLEKYFITFIYQPIFNEAAQITGILVFAIEVTDQVKLRHKLQELGQAK